MVRVRFTIVGHDPRPMKWPLKYPYWVSGYDSYIRPIIIAYAETSKELHELWPDICDISDVQIVDKVEFSERFPKPHGYEGEAEVC